jgi:hypothetical protein
MRMNDLPPPPGSDEKPRMPPLRTGFGKPSPPKLPAFSQLRPGAQVIGGLLYVFVVLVLVMLITGTASLIVKIIREAL